MASRPASPTPKSDDEGGELDPSSVVFSPEEEASLLAESDALKATANAHFIAGRHADALDAYASALATCPAYLHGPRAVLWSNSAACHLKMEAWREAADAATRAVECLDGCLKKGEEEGNKKEEEGEEKEKEKGKGKEKEKEKEKEKDGEEDEDVEEIPRPDRPDIQPRPPTTTTNTTTTNTTSPSQKPSPPPLQDSPTLRPIRIKTLLRRATALTALATWQDLTSAQADYTTLLQPSPGGLGPFLRAPDRALAQRNLADVKKRTDAAREKEMGEMWGKLKDLGNGLLRPFGLSTENFSMVKDEGTGGYSMNFKQNGE